MPGRPRKELSVGRMRMMVLQYEKTKIACQAPDDLLANSTTVTIGKRKRSALSHDGINFHVEGPEDVHGMQTNATVKRVGNTEHLRT